MTIPVGQRKAGPFIGDNIAVQFPFAFKIFTPDDVSVIVADTSGEETKLTISQHYNVTINPDQSTHPGGNILLNNPLPMSEKLSVVSTMDIEQNTVYSNSGPFYPEVLNDDFDKQTIFAQQNADKLSRAVKVAINSGVTDLTLPVPVARNVLQWNADGKLVNYDIEGAIAKIVGEPGGVEQWKIEKLFHDTEIKVIERLSQTRVEVQEDLSRTQIEVQKDLSKTKSEIADKLSEIDTTGKYIPSSSISNDYNDDGEDTVASSKALNDVKNLISSPGKILQVKQEVLDTDAVINTTEPYDILTCQIQPISETSNILVTVSVVVSSEDNISRASCMRLLRNGVNITKPSGASQDNAFWFQSTDQFASSISANYLDTDKPLGLLTYKLQTKIKSSSYALRINRSSANTVERFISTITLMEIEQ